jgi:hypothetical protein
MVIAGGLSAAGAGLLARTWASDGSVRPQGFGAVGNGFANDTAAVMASLRAAFDSGRPVDGGGAVFAVSGNLRFQRQTRPWIRSLRLRQLNPSDDRKTLNLVDCQSIRIDRLEINVGPAKDRGYMNASGGLWVQGGSGHRISNVEVFGHGKNSLIAIWNTRGGSYANLQVRDAEFDDPRATDDVMQGIWLNRNIDCVIEKPRVWNLGGNASFRGRAFRNLRTRGIALGGNVRCSVIEPMVRDVDQGIDFSGSDGNADCRVSGGRAFQCTSVGLKFANSAQNCRASGFISERCGAQGFLVSGPSEVLPRQTSGIELSDCVALDSGYNGFPTTTAGFLIQAGARAAGPLVFYPKGVRFIRCRAVDTQTPRTMDYGFYTNVPRSPGGSQPNELVDCYSEGYLITARLGAWRIS